MSDVTAVVLSIGEAYTERAVDAVRRQSLPPREIVVVRGISPVHRALNHAVGMVKTDFFVEVDSDMILARHSFADLRAAMAPNVGLAMGPLTDPLMGIISGVKMIRTEVCRKIRFRDTISSDRSFYRDMKRLGYRHINLLSPSDDPDGNKKIWHSFGRHEPDYSPLYTYSKYRLLGRRYRSWRDLGGLQWRFRRLKRCPLEMALIAQVAMGHGIFSPDLGDGLRPFSRSGDFDFLMQFLTTPQPARFPAERPADLPSGNAERDFQRCYELAATIASEGSPEDLKTILAALHSFDEEDAWVSKVGLCHGLFAPVAATNRAATAFSALADFTTPA